MGDEPRLFKVGRTWHTWFYRAGRRCKQSTGCRARGAALVAARRIEEAAQSPALAAAAATTLDDALFAVLQRRREQAKAGERSADTVEFYRKKGGPLGRLLGSDTPLACLTAEVLDGYVSSRRRERAATPTIYKEMTVLRAALKLAKRHGKWGGDVDALIPPLSGQSKPRERFLTPGQLDQLLAELTSDHAARAAFCVATGAETRATVNALRSDASKRQVQLHGTKRTTREREVPIITGWQRALLKYALEHAKGAAPGLFRHTASEFRWSVKYAARRAGIEHCTPNDLRRTFSTWMKAAGGSNESLAPIMGHADGRMLDRTYARLPLELLRERLAVELGHSLDRPSRTRKTRKTSETRKGAKTVPRGGIEPPTRGFSVPCQIWHKPREHAALSAVQRRRLDTVWTARTGRDKHGR